MPQTLYTVGYEKRDIEEFISVLRDAAIDVLVDVRETAWSHKPGFSKSALCRALAEEGIEYLHASFAGNPKWLRREASTHAECLMNYAWYVDAHEEVLDALDALLGSLIEQGRRVCLMCFERHPADCHRGILADRWKGRGRRRIEHLAPAGCERLVPA